MGVSKERRHAGRATRRRRRARTWWRAIGRRMGVELCDWQIEVLIAQGEARRRGETFVYVQGRRGGWLAVRKVAEGAGQR